MHIPVLLKEAISCLDPQPNENFIDGTFGEGGHSLAILKRTGPRGKVLGIDQDPKILGNVKYKIQDTKYKDRLVLVTDNFANLKKVIEKENFTDIAGILLDLGLSRWHLEESNRGFSFQKDESLNMRLDGQQDDKAQNVKRKAQNYDLTAYEIVNYWPGKDIERVLREYSQERFSRKIAEAICETRKAKPIKTTLQLVEIVKRAVPRNYERRRIHPATRIFLALRIAVNRELENLERVLPQVLEVLNKGGRIVVISFNSLEDRIVKNFLAQKSKAKLRILTKKPVTPGLVEIKNNPRSRSARLRAAVKI